MSEGGAERERETRNLKQASGSGLSAQSLTQGLNLQATRSWAEVGHLTDWATQAPLDILDITTHTRARAHTHTHTHTLTHHCLEPVGSPHLWKFFTRAVPLKIWRTKSSILVLYPNSMTSRGEVICMTVLTAIRQLTCLFMENINHAHWHRPKAGEKASCKNRIFNGYIPLVFQIMT